MALDLQFSLWKQSTRRMPDKSSLRVRKLNRREVRDLDVKITFMEGIVRRDPRYVEALQILGDHYTQRGRFGHSWGKAVNNYRRAVVLTSFIDRRGINNIELVVTVYVA